MSRAAALVAALVVAALLGASDGAATQAQNPQLRASVGPDMTISLRTAGGAAVTRLDPGAYDIQVEDLSDLHNFHLSGPGVDQQTGIGFTGPASWTVTFGNGTYVFRCDVHPSSMRGTFTSGTVPTPTPPPVKIITAKTRLVLTSGPKPVITLKTAAGAKVSRMKVGTYRVTVRDRSRIHNAHIKAPGYDRKTKVAFVGAQPWKVALKRAGTLRFLCDEHPSTMRGSAKIVR